MPYRIKTLMRSVNKTSFRVLDEGVHEKQNEILVMKSFMVLHRAYVLCFAKSLCFMFCIRSMFYVFQKAYEMN